MRKKKVIQVQRGTLTGTGETKTLARADLDKQIDFACDHVSDHIESRYGLALVLSGGPHGYGYAILEPENLSEHGRTHWTRCLMTTRDYGEALNGLRSAACQRAWTADVNDAEHIARAGVWTTSAAELARLFAHYRAEKAPEFDPTCVLCETREEPGHTH
jgi:hypothetical protein